MILNTLVSSAGAVATTATAFGAGLYYAHRHQKEMQALKAEGLMPAMAKTVRPVDVKGTFSNFKNGLFKIARLAKLRKRDDKDFGPLA